MRDLYAAMKQATVQALNELDKELIGIEVVQNIAKDTGEITYAVRCSVEVSKNQGDFSRTRFTVKVTDTTKLKVTQEELETADYKVIFVDLAISFISSNTGTVYFKASNYEVEKVEEE